MLVKGIDEIVRSVRKEINPFIVFNTNLITHVDQLTGMLPDIDVLHFSYDGPGDIGVSHRGVSGDRVLENLNKVVQKYDDYGSHFPLLLGLGVITKENYHRVDEILEPLAECKAPLLVNFGTVEPYWHELSIIPHPELVADFHKKIEPWKKRMRVEVHGILASPPHLEEAESGAKDQEEHLPGMMCYRQFFRAQVMPDGTALTCKPDTYLRYYRELIQNAKRKRQWLKMLQLVQETRHTLLKDPTCAYCPFPCKCEEYVDDIFKCKDGDPVPPQTIDLKGRFKKEELEKMDRFLIPRLGHPLSREVREILLGE